MRGLIRTVGAFISGTVVFLLVLLMLALILAGLHAPPREPGPAQQAKEAQRTTEIVNQEREESERQAEYRRLGIK